MASSQTRRRDAQKPRRRPDSYREARATIVGRAIAIFCHVGGWLAPMFGAGKLESGNFREYETAARDARDCGRDDLIDCLLAYHGGSGMGTREIFSFEGFESSLRPAPSPLARASTQSDYPRALRLNLVRRHSVTGS